MRDPVLEHFPPAPSSIVDTQAYLKQVDDIYVTDAYHSLSIEGYQKNALAARGYWQAFQAVKASVEKVIVQKEEAIAGSVAQSDHDKWYRELFAPSVTAGILEATDLAGYRNHPVYIRRSMHVPPNYQAVRELIPTFFDLLQNEKEPAARVVLGHYFFVYIHPYMDGNGRMGRFLMNVMLAILGWLFQWSNVPNIWLH